MTPIPKNNRLFTGVHILAQSQATPTFRDSVKQLCPAHWHLAGVRHSGQPLTYWMSEAAPFTPTPVMTADIGFHFGRRYNRLGILWVQGEHGWKGTTDDSGYDACMNACMSHLASQLLLPGGTLYEVLIQPYRTDDATAYAAVRAVMTARAAASPTTRTVIDSTPWPRATPGDTVHWTLAAARDLAAPAAAAALMALMPD